MSTRIHEPADLGAALRAARVAAGLSQRALAEKLGTIQSAVSEWERGLVDLQVKTLLRILTQLGLHLHLTAADAHPVPDVEATPSTGTTRVELDTPGASVKVETNVGQPAEDAGDLALRLFKALRDEPAGRLAAAGFTLTDRRHTDDVERPVDAGFGRGW